MNGVTRRMMPTSPGSSTASSASSHFAARAARYDSEASFPFENYADLRDVDAMRASGLGLGGSLDNAVVVDGARIVNEGGLRDPQEFALHKTLDIIGDLALVGAPLIGRIRAHKSGHDLHTALARLILKESLKVPKPDLASIAR